MKNFLILTLLLSLASIQSAVGKTFYTSRNAMVRSIAHDGQYVYVGTSKGLFVINKGQGTQSTYYPYWNEDGVIGSVELNGDELYVGLNNWRIANYHHGITENFYFEGNGHNEPQSSEAIVSSIAFDAHRQPAVAVVDYLCVRDGEQTHTYWLSKSFVEGAIQDMQYDSQGRLWLVCDGNSCTNNTLSVYSPAEGLMPMLGNYINSGQQNGSLSSDCLAIDADDHIWLGTERGKLVEYDGNDFIFHDIGLNLTYISDIAFDGDGVLWILASTKNNYCLISYIGDIATVLPLDLLPGERGDCLDVDGSTAYVGTNKHLLVISNGQQIRVTLAEGDMSGIEETVNCNYAATVAVDLQGRCLSTRPAKGVYIVNGRKYIGRYD